MTHPDQPALWPASLTIDDGVWQLGGHPLTDLAQRFGTPAYFLDVEGLRGRALHYRNAFAQAFGPRTQVYYAGKAFLSMAVARWVHQEGLGIDTASLGELTTALAAGVPGADIGLHGNNKSDAELRLALESAVGRIVIDSLDEIDRLEALAAHGGQVAQVLVRITTGVHAGGHEFIATAHEDQKFGLSLASGAAAEALQRVTQAEHLRLRGLHSHIGSQILDPAGFAEAARALLRLRADHAERTGELLGEVDLGGGYGIAYLPGEDEADIGALADDLARTCRQECTRLATPMPDFSFEPGRSIIGPSMVTLYRVGTVKPVPVEEGGTRWYVSVDGGMSDNIRPALYGADYHAELVSRPAAVEQVLARVVGKHCESGDVLVHQVHLPADIRSGDLLAVPATGAYGRSMASQYNLVPRPGVVAVEPEEARQIVRRETIEDILALDLG